MQRPLFFKRWFLQGIVVLLPVIVTASILYYGIVYTDQLLWFLWDLLPITREKPHIFPGLGLLIVFAAITVIGALAESWLVNQAIKLFNGLMARLPFIRSIYSTVLKVSENAFGSTSKFSSVVLIEYPSPGTYTIAFKTGMASKQLRSKFTCNENFVNVFVPTTPNPTSGFYLLVAESKVTELDIAPEQAFKVILSAGIMDD